jgi:hypothetical protein
MVSNFNMKLKEGTTKMDPINVTMKTASKLFPEYIVHLALQPSFHFT